MNHIYKTVWNKAKNMFVVASEIASGQGKTSSEKNPTSQQSHSARIFSASMTALASMLYLQSVDAASTIATGTTLVHSANNGVQVIDIAATNQAGISHNRYINYNVNKTGQILNNAAMDAKNLSVMTSLAGKIHTNANLKESARLILNEVTGTQRSSLNGYIEIAGQKADVIIANPYGITCTGCGFINTDYSVLTSGKPNVGLDGRLNSFDVTRGDITINGLGLDASQQPLLKLISRNVYLDGQINAQDLSIITGTNQYNFETGQIKTIDSDTVGNPVAIDSTQLGGIYANKISLLATEQGVGVRMAGDAAANTDEFILTSAGSIELKNQVSAQNNISIQNFTTNKNTLDLKGDLTAHNIYVGTAGNASFNTHLNDASLFAENNVSFNVHSVEANETALQAKGKINLDVNQNIDLDTSSIHANNSVNLRANTLSTAGKTSFSSQNDLNLNTKSTLTLGDDANLIAKNALKIQNIANNITLGSAQLLSNESINISSDSGNIDIKRADIQTAKTLKLDAQSIGLNANIISNNTSFIAAENVTAKKDTSITTTELVDIQAKNIDVLGQAIANNITLNASETYTSGSNSKTLAQDKISLEAKNANVEGILGANNLNINLLENLKQAGQTFAQNLFVLNAKNAELSGKNSANDMTLKLDGALEQKSASVISVEDSLIINAKDYQNSGNTLSNNLTGNLSDHFIQNGYLGATHTINMTAKEAVLNGTTEAENLYLQVSEHFTNTGTLLADNVLTINAHEVVLDGNEDTFVSATTVSVKANSVDQKQGSFIQATDKLDLAASDHLTLSGETQAQTAKLTATEQVNLNNTSSLTVNNSLDIDSKDISLEGNILAKNIDLVGQDTIKTTGNTQAIDTFVLNAGSADLDGDLFAKNATVTTAHNIEQKGGIYITENLDINANNITQNGLIFSKNADLKASGNLLQTEHSELVSDQAINLQAQDIQLKGVTVANVFDVSNTKNLLLNGQAQIQEGTTLKADQITLDGLLITGSATIHALDKVIQNQNDIISASGRIELKSNQMNLAGQTVAYGASLVGTNGVSNQGAIQSYEDLTIHSDQDIQLTETSKLVAQGIIQLDTKANINAEGNETNQSVISSNSDVTLQADKQINFNGQVFGKNITVASLEQLNTGKFSSLRAQDKLNLTSTNQSLNLSGLSYADQQNLNAKTDINIQAPAKVEAKSELNIITNTLSNHGVVRNSGTTHFALANLFNTGSLLSDAYSQVSKPIDPISFSQFDNSGLFFSSESLSLHTDSLNNSGDLISNNDLNVDTKVFKNTDESNISAVNNLNLKSAQDNTVNSGVISAGEKLFIDAKALVNKNNLKAQNVELKVNQFTNEKDMLAQQDIVIQSASRVTNQGEIYAGQSVTITSEDAIVNQSLIYTGADENAAVTIKAKSLDNSKQNVGNTTINGVISTTLLDVKANAITNASKILAAQANIAAQDGTSLASFTNNKQATFALLNNKSKEVSNLKTNITNNTDATILLDASGSVVVTGHLDNKGFIYAEGDSDLTTKSLNNNSAHIVLDDSKLKVQNDYRHTGTLEAYNQSNLEFSSLNNDSRIVLDTSTLEAFRVLNNNKNSVINASGTSSITAKTLTNEELILASGEDANLSIDADQLNLNELSGLISQGTLSLNTNKSSSNTIKNLGHIFAKGDLSIGTSVTNFSNLMSKNEKLSGEANTAYGGVVSSDSNINFDVNHFTNNYQINSSDGNIVINADGNFSNETVYYGEKLNLGYVWKVPTFTMTAPNRDQRDTRYYDSDNVKYKQVSNAGSGDGVDGVLVTENWYLSTVYNGSLDYDTLSPYLNVNNNIAQIRANSGDIIVNLNNHNAEANNYGAKIIADKNIKINAMNIDFKNKTIDVFKDKRYELEYLLMSDKDNRHRLAYRKDATNNATLVRGDIDDDSYERTNNYLDVLDSSKINFIVWDSSNDVQTKVRNRLKNNGFDLTPFKKTEKTSGSKEAQAIVSAGSSLTIKASSLSNSSNTTKAFVGNEKKENPVTDGAYTGNKEEACDVNTCPTEKSEKPTDAKALENKTVDLTPTEEAVGKVDTQVDLEDVNATETEKVSASEKVDAAATTVDPIITKPSGPRVVNNDYPMDKIPTVNVKLPNAADKYAQYVTVKNPNAEFLVESNPLYGQSSDVLGSNYLRDELGIEPDLTVKRLGDSRYEQELVRQQVEQITNKATISDQKMQQYFDNAIEASKDLGFVYGKPLTTSQIQQLDKDIVWMVEKVVNGQRVLVPQVYLSYETLQNIDDSGSVLEGEEGVHLDVDSLENNESMIKGGTVVIDAKNDINNIGATIKGRDVQLTSKEGSINNITQAFNYGDKHSGSTYIGPTAGIISENNLVLDAAKDINITGAKVKAGGNAVFEAGNDINITTIQDKRASTSTSRDGKTTTNIASTTHIGSEIDIGGSAYLKSGNDTVISGSEFNTGGNFVADTGGDFKLVSVQDTVETNTKSSKSGIGVGGGLWGSQTTETNEFVGKNKASTLNVGGVVDIASENKVVIEGSDINVASTGMSRIHGAKGVDILDGKDEYSKETTVTTTTFLKLDNKSEAKAGASANAEGTQASADAEASASSQTSLKLMESTIDHKTEKEKLSVASNINSNGGLAITSDEGTVHVRGSNVDVKGALIVDAKNIVVEAGKNEKTTTSNTESKSIGIYREDSASASAKAATGAEHGSGAASAEAGVSVEANLESTTTFGAMSESSSSYTNEVTNNLASLKGGTVSLTAQETARFEGADVRSEGSMRIKATDIENRAVQDTYESSSSSSSNLTGVYVGASANASASASIGANADGLLPAVSGGASAEASVSAELSAGLRTNSKSSEESYSKTTNLGNNFVAGGDFERIAENSIIDEATAVTAGGTIRQAAKKVVDIAVHDTETKTSTSSEKEARLGVYAGVGAGAKAEASADANQFGSEAGKNVEVNKPEASAGLQASYNATQSTGTSTESKAVVSKFKAQNIESDVSGHMELNGASFEAENNLTLNAGSLTLNEAINTRTETSSKDSFDINAKIGLVGTPSAEFGLGMEQGNEASRSVVGQGSSLTGKNVAINVDGKLKNEGTIIQSDNQPSINAKQQIVSGLTNISESESQSSGFKFGVSDQGVSIDVNRDGYKTNLSIKNDE